MTSSSLPPDMVQFATDRDGVSQLSFHNNNSNGNSAGGLYGNALNNGMQQQQQQQPNGGQQQQAMGNNQSGNMTLQLPLPTPIAGLGQQQQTGSTTMNTNQSNQQQQQPQMFQGTQNSNNNNAAGQNATLAQLIAQLQQSTNNSGQIQQQPQQAQQPQQPQQPNMQQLQSPPQQQQPQQAANQQQQPQQQQQMNQFQFGQFSSDPQALLRQLQFAQLQQQLQAAQSNQPQQMQAPQNMQQQKPEASQQQPQNSMPLAAPTAPLVQQQRQQGQVPTVIQQQLQQHFQQAQAAAISSHPQQQAPPPPPPVSNPSNSMMAPTHVSVANKPSNKKPPPAPKVSRSTAASFNKNMSTSGTVSASDTDVDSSKRVKVSETLSMEMDDDDLKLEPLDTTNMTPQEKAKANRDRNREHARNTRLRKKAYLEKLKTTVDELCRERDTLVSERAGAANLLVEMHNTRTEVLMSFFALRTTNEKRRKLWSSIIDESCFACVMPVTPYRSFPASEVQVSKCLRTVMGIDGIMADTASLHVLIESLVDRSKHPYGKINFRYTLVTEEAVVAGNQMMARWVMTTTNAVQLGSTMEVSKQGMLCCKFNSAHKIIGLELMFDVMAFMLQLKQAAGSEGFTVIPNTIQTCQKSFDKPMVVTLAEPPYTIVQVNNLWEEMTGYTAEEVVGKVSCSILQPPGIDRKPLADLMQEVRFKRPASALLINRNKSGVDFTNYLVVYPLSTDSRITYFLGLTTFTKTGHPSGTPSIMSGVQQTQPNTTMAGQGNYNSITQVTSAGPQGVMMPPMMFGQMPPPSASAGMLNLQQQQAQHQQQQNNNAVQAIASWGTKRPREE